MATPATAAPTQAPPTDGDRAGFKPGFGGRKRGGGRKRFEEEWIPCTKLGRLVKSGQIKSLEEIYVHSLPIKEYQIIDHFIKELSDEVMKIISVQKQTRAGQRTRFKAVIAVGDRNGHVGLGVKVAKEVQIAIQDGLKIAKLNIIPVRRGYWGSKFGEVHTVPCKMTGKSGSVKVRLVPASKGVGIVGAPPVKKMLQFAGVKDCYTSSCGQTRTKENFLKATYIALSKYYSFLTPDLWNVKSEEPSPMDVHSEFLKNYKAEFEKKRRGRGRGGRRGGRGRGGARSNTTFRGRGGAGGTRGGSFGGQPTQGEDTAQETQAPAEAPVEAPAAAEGE